MELRPLPPTQSGFPDLWIWRKAYFLDYPVGFGVWGDLQSIGNSCGLQMDGFSAHFKPSESIFDAFHDFGHFAIDSGSLALFSEGPRALRECPEGPGAL